MRRTLAVLLLIYGVASLVHFVHNAVYLADYPNLPASWTRADVYVAWLGMTAVGIAGWLLLKRGCPRSGLLVLAIYAAFGLDSLGHYLRAPMRAHRMSMNASILMEVTAAGAVFALVLWLLVHGNQSSASESHASTPRGA